LFVTALTDVLCTPDFLQEHEKHVTKSNGYDVVAIRDNWNTWVDTFRECPVTSGPAAAKY